MQCSKCSEWYHLGTCVIVPPSCMEERWYGCALIVVANELAHFFLISVHLFYSFIIICFFCFDLSHHWTAMEDTESH